MTHLLATVSPGSVPQRPNPLQKLLGTASSLAQLWGVPGLAAGVTIEFSPRLSRSLGRSLPVRKIVRLHADLASGPQALLREVLCHELAHLVAFQLDGNGVRAHGPIWAALVAKAGYRPRTHLQATSVRSAPNRPRHRYEHACPVCHARRLASRPMRRWRCTRCLEAGLPGRFQIRRIT
ncbi:MAG: SprT-like domain-containing protein [Deltaproteobacteria bacterium]|nr:SprT-like domain-containing protein [Deltaproteobacteria bacterium]